LGALIGRIVGIEVVIYSQTELYKPYGLIRRVITKIILKILNAKWMTPIMGDKSIYHTFPKGMHFVPFAVDIEKKDKRENLDSYNLLSIGKYEERKNQLMLLKVFKKLLENNFPVTLTLIGEVSKEIHKNNFKECHSYVKVNNLEKKIEMLVNVPHSDISKFYKTADLFVLPATEEPASISVLEAVGLGTPALCSDTNGTRFYLLENNFGTTFLDGDRESLYNQISKTLNKDRLQVYKHNIKRNNENVLSKCAFYESFITLLNNETM
jgi:glycosyltransferase involved in cell wall biosynthesis